jgi:hypothetical protein
MDPWADPGKGYQLSHALIAFGRGEWIGVGLGASVEKLFYLPGGAHRLPARGDRRGIRIPRRLTVLSACSPGSCTRAFAIGRQAARLGRSFAALVAQGVGLWIGVQALINMGVNMGVLPTKGLTLPLLSFGGSGLVANMRRRGDPAARRLRKQAAHARLRDRAGRSPGWAMPDGMEAQLTAGQAATRWPGCASRRCAARDCCASCCCPSTCCAASARPGRQLGRHPSRRGAGHGRLRQLSRRHDGLLLWHSAGAA